MQLRKVLQKTYEKYFTPLFAMFGYIKAVRENVRTFHFALTD